MKNYRLPNFINGKKTADKGNNFTPYVTTISKSRYALDAKNRILRWKREGPFSCTSHRAAISFIWVEGSPKIRLSIRYCDIDLLTWNNHFATGYFHMPEIFQVPGFLLQTSGLKNYCIMPGTYRITAAEGHLYIVF
ncbi:MAG: hypothetical protein IPL65_19825 [Lewinellaceae bacterium]|nr:hypothetical protein [Lewinellaceae bacterium]